MFRPKFSRLIQRRTNHSAIEKVAGELFHPATFFRRVLMKSYVLINKSNLQPLPDIFASDGRFDPKLIEVLVTNYSLEGDKVFDPFSGFGTTICVAESLNRVGYGIELDDDRYRYSVSICNNVDNIIHGDLMNIPVSKLPKMDLCITSPTYSWKNMGCNPFDLYMGEDSYEQYLISLYHFFRKIVQHMKNGSHIIIDTSNIRFQNVTTTLAWDVEYILNRIKELEFEREIIVCWEGDDNGFLGGTYGFGYDHSYCLVFMVHNSMREGDNL